MTQAFIHDDFLLQSEAAKRLYHDYAKEQPIIDYHCHLSPEEVATNQSWDNMAQVWLGGDHYKWRAMRSNGISEDFCTGDRPDREKFQAFAQCMPNLLRNPLYHWSQLELKRYFGIDTLLNGDTAEEIWTTCNDQLKQDSHRARGFMKSSNVKLVCTTDDPIDNLEHHTSIAKEGFEVKVLPTWRPDKAMAVEVPEVYNAYLEKLESASGLSISTYDDLLAALQQRHDFFHEVGCRLSDHGIETAYAEDYTDAEIKAIFNKVRSGNHLNENEILKFKSAIMVEGGIMDHSKGWTQQFHIGPIRNQNTRLFNQLGPDTGFDSIGDDLVAKPLGRFLDRLDTNGQLTKTILYNINPSHNAVYGTMIGNFQDGSSPGKIQFGSGWWFNDQKLGMEDQINFLSQLGLISRFVGMLTDSRSFLSYTRHEYFRRILCNLLGNDINEGQIPEDYELVGQMVSDISYNNASSYFGFDLD
jgi:glucuronate isomerase